MTIAVGHKVLNGLIVAADTLVTKEDGSATSEPKIISFLGESGTFVIAVATEDLESARTLVNGIKERLVTEKPAIFGEVQGFVTHVMTKWFKAYGLHMPPPTQLIIGMRLKSDKPRLVFCEPPITFVEKDEGYAAIGLESITDPLYDLLFASSLGLSVQSGLRRVAYLISRAKRDNASAGKRTLCYVIGPSEVEPIFVNFLDIQEQENKSSALDFLLHSAALFALESSPDALEKNATGLGDMLKGLASIRSTVFHDTYGQEIQL